MLFKYLRKLESEGRLVHESVISMKSKELPSAFSVFREYFQVATHQSNDAPTDKVEFKKWIEPVGKFEKAGHRERLAKAWVKLLEAAATCTPEELNWERSLPVGTKSARDTMCLTELNRGETPEMANLSWEEKQAILKTGKVVNDRDTIPERLKALDLKHRNIRNHPLAQPLAVVRQVLSGVNVAGRLKPALEKIGDEEIVIEDMPDQVETLTKAQLNVLGREPFPDPYSDPTVPHSRYVNMEKIKPIRTQRTDDEEVELLERMIAEIRERKKV